MGGKGRKVFIGRISALFLALSGRRLYIILNKNCISEEKFREVRTESNRKYYWQTAVYPLRAWPKEEIIKIMERKISDRELSKQLQRSIKAIVNKRSSEKERNMQKIKIGICDDFPEAVETLSDIVSNCLEKKEYAYKIEKFYNGTDILAVIQQMDIVFLDIEMPGTDGIETGARMQKSNADCKIIMATSRADRFKEAFRINAFRFVTKPFDSEEIALVLDETLNSMLGIETVELYLNRIPYNVQQKDILYVKAYESYVGVFVKNRGMMRKDMSLTKIMSLLDSRIFYRADRKYAVNLSFIEDYRRGVIKITDIEIKVPRGKKKDFEKEYEEFRFRYS